MTKMKGMEFLGFEVEDKVSGAKGVVVSISYDLYGCIQAFVRAKVTKEGKEGECYWLDICRLKTTSTRPVMDQPTFAVVPGPERKTPLP